ncbi:family 16 glycosylhydrolase [Streptomyces sp. A7024]|uniref:Family 16 glycosylhydrolase n=1 Tax=Streptomyces coryli TaxID=1128680 RepID=A0A6G4TTC0_9ACTN|nr:glycoside hydrolase family 16 protein [Streptomyces coryli]NGN63114.1 family 16 glycosylhydrolase [Streptomyces coryli]
MPRATRLTLAAAAAAGLLALAPATTAGAAATAPPGTGWTLAFNDEFNDTTVDTAKWNFRTDVKAYSAQRAQNVTESGGALSLNLKKEAYGGKDFTGGGVISKKKLRYGYYETRAKINDGAGWHTSFWLMAGDGSTTYPADRRTEVDGFETDSINPTKTSHNVHGWRGPTTDGAVHYGSGHYDTGLDLRDWHTYGFDWSETSVKFYIDGALKYTAPYTPDKGMHDFTSVWLTSIAYGTVPDASKLPSAAQFDYVRYWQRDYYVDNDGPGAYGYATSGTWQRSSLTGWTKDSPVDYACAAGAKATWKPNLRAAGSYEAYIRKTASSTGGDPAAKVTLDNGGSVTTRTLDERSGSSGWVSLGTQTYAAGTGSSVSLTASGTGCAHADAIKFVRR